MQFEPNVLGADIRAAYAVIAPYVRRTPLIEAASPIAGAPAISLKLEFLQHAGSFKPRGAFHNLLTRAAPPVGCATASGGNHGAAVAYAAAKLGVRARVFVPEIAAPPKIAKIKAYGAEVVVQGAAYAEAQALCDAYVAESGALAIHPYATAATVAGQGTVGLEWEEDLARLGLRPIDTALVAVGGGGLVAGVAAWFDGRAKVVGVEPEGSRALDAALEAGRPVDVPVKSVADAAISAAQRWLWRELQIAVEPSGAAVFAALASGAYRSAAGERVGVLVCGANVDLDALAALVAG